MYFNLRLFAMTEGLRWRIAVAAIVGLLAVVAGIARLTVTGVIIARVFEGEALSDVAVLLTVVAALIVLRVVLQYWRDTVSYWTAARTKIELRKRLYEHSLALGPGHFDQRRTGDVLVSLIDGVENLEVFFGQYLPQFIVAAIAPVLIFVFMAVLDIQIGLIFLVFAALTLFIPHFLKDWNIARSRARRSAYGALGADFLDSVQGLATLKAFGQARERGVLLADRARHLYKTTMGVVAVDGASMGATTLGVSAGAVAALVWGGSRVADGTLELSTLLIVLMLGGEVFRPLRELAALYHQGMTAMSSAEGIFNLLDTPVEIQDPDEKKEAGELKPEVAFESVTFGYEGGRRRALHDVSFVLHEGETLGLVGSSGAGKSTVVWLLLRFHDPLSGRVTLDGADIRDLPLDVLRDQIAVVTQDTYLFHGTVADNLRLGNPDAPQDKLEEAARAANAHEFIVALPQGYDTIVGERGIRLSGGQRQRVAIGRAILKEAPILVLDEALSNVDAESESMIQEALDRLMAGKTTLVIAHRLSSVIGADRILVLDDGDVVETGTHDELVAKEGAYHRLMAAQQVSSDEDIIVSTLPPEEAVASPDVLLPPVEQTGDAVGRVQPGSLATWNRLFGVARRWRGRLAATLGLGLTHHLASVVLGAVSAVLVARVFNQEDTGVAVALLAGITLLAAAARWGENWASHDMAYRLLAEMRIDIYNRLEPLAPAYLVRRRSGDLAGVVGSDVENIENFFAHVITPAMVALIVPAGVLAVLVFVSWPLALVLAPFLLVAAVSPFYEQRRSEALGSEIRDRLGEMSAHMVDGIQGMREIVAFGAGPARTQETADQGWEFSRHRVGFLKAQAFQNSFIEALTALGGLTVLTTGVWLIVNGNMERTQLPLVTLLALTSFMPVTELANTLKQLLETLAATRRVFAIFDEPVPVRDGPGLEDGGLQEVSVHFDDVDFAYERGLPQALRDVTFEIATGQTVALVGRSGAGKSTTANMLMRFWDPNDGDVALDGHNLREFKLDDLRQKIALVSQDTYLFNTTVRENLRMAKLDATDEEIGQAASMANVAEFVDDFPDGYDTMVGERGMQLSGGQRQRISIARALLKDAPVLVLDEATSHLDAVNEQQVREALQRLMKGRTTLVIAHRLSTVRDADRIVVMDSGRVVEEGTHDELLARGGLYAQLVQRQLVAAAKR